MRRVCVLILLLGGLLIACGKYSPPRRVRHEPPAPAPAEATAEPEAQADEPAEAQEEDP